MMNVYRSTTGKDGRDLPEAKVIRAVIPCGDLPNIYPHQLFKQIKIHSTAVLVMEQSLFKI